MKTICAKGETVKGFDVSHYQPNVDFAGLKAQGNEFCFIKACEGYTTDPKFKSHWANAKAAGLLRGAYCFFHPDVHPDVQAAHLVSLVGKLGAGDLPCVMDWETTEGVSAASDRAAGLSFLRLIETGTGKTPIIYGSPYFLQALNLDVQFATYPLWIAEYGISCPKIPAPFGTWTFWQFHGSGMDYNLFNGPSANLHKFAL